MNEIQYENLTLREADGELTVVGCDKQAVSVAIPEYVLGKPVTAIGANAFEDCELLCEVSFPDYSDDFFLNGYTFREIGDYAFSCCKSLKGINLPFSIWSIGRGAFSDCRSLVTAEFGDEAYVAPYAFYRCTSLKSVPKLKCISEGVFSHCESLADFPVSDGTEVISEDSFEHCDSLTDIVIPRSVKIIEPLAFRGCKSLSSVTFEDTEGWSARSVYTEKVYGIDLSSAKENAKMLSQMDFDDGVGSWYKG